MSLALSDLQKQIEKTKGQPIAAYEPLLSHLADYFMSTLPSNLDDAYILAIEQLLNELYLRAHEEAWPTNLQEALLETVSMAGELGYIIKKRPFGKQRTKEFFRTVKQLGTLLQLLIIYIDHE